MSLFTHYSILLLPFSVKLFEQMSHNHCLYFLTSCFLFLNLLEFDFFVILLKELLSRLHGLCVSFPSS